MSGKRPYHYIIIIIVIVSIGMRRSKAVILRATHYTHMVVVLWFRMDIVFIFLLNERAQCVFVCFVFCCFSSFSPLILSLSYMVD